MSLSARRGLKEGHGESSTRRRLHAPLLLIVMAALLIAPAGASAALLNPSFESGTLNSSNITDWSASKVDPAGAVGPASCTVPDGVCLLGSDAVQIDDDGDSTADRTVNINPLDGSRMVRLGGPFMNSSQSQTENETYRLEQTFTVDPANPIEKVNYRVLTFDYTGFDELLIRVTLFDENGQEILRRQTGAWGPGGDTTFKDSGWRGAGVNLAGYEGQQVRMRIDVRGTSDNLYGFWVYIDAGDAPTPPFPVATTTTPGVEIGTFIDPNTGLTYFTAPNSQVGAAGGCVPLTINVPIEPGAGTVSNVKLLVEPRDGGGASEIVMDNNPPGSNNWAATIPCIANSNLRVSYTLTEGADAQTFVILIGGIALIDPQGIVYDELTYNLAIRAGKTPEQARAEGAITGASVRLQRSNGSVFNNVLSGDPGIFPNVNPQITAANGKFQWDVSAGRYRVVVTADGYPLVTSREVDIPPPVLDLHVAMCKTGVNCNPPPPDTVNAGIAKVAGKITVKGGYALIKLKSAEDNAGRITLTTAKAVKASAKKKKAKKLKLGSKSFKLTANKATTIKVKISRAGLKLLRRGGLKTVVAITAKDKANNATSSKRTVTLKLAKAKKKSKK
jgi:hypothetical protein